MTCLFWICLFLIFFAYPGYPLLIGLVSRFLTMEVSQEGPEPGSVSVVIAAHNEEKRIEARLRNLLECEHPDAFEIVVVCGACEDETAARARSLSPAIRVIEEPGSRSKPRGLNRGMAAATGEIVVFADARQRFAADTMVELLKPFADPGVGAVSGNLSIEETAGGTGAGIDLYWKLEKFLREAESRIDSSIGCTGAIYAIRRKCFHPIPADTLLDDVVIPMRIAIGGKRVLFRNRARAYDPQTLGPDSESRRTVRTLAGNYQMLFRYPGWLLPWKNRLWFQLAAHKYARLFGPLYLAGILGPAFFLREIHWIYGFVFWGAAAALVLGLLGLIFRGVKWKAVSIPAGFLFLQWQCLRSFFYYLRFTWKPGDGW